MLETIIVNVIGACYRRADFIVIVASTMAIGASLYTYENFAIHTDTCQLISQKLPWRQRELQLDAAFPQQVDTRINPNKGFNVRLTGPVAMADEEFGTLAEGALLNVVLTTAAVLLILWFALRSFRVVLAVRAVR